MRTLVNLNPAAEFRAMEEMFDRVFGAPVRPNGTPATALPLDIEERDGKLVVRASVPGIDPKDLDIQVENNVLSIRGEVRHESETNDAKIYRREISTGAFARSIRLPEGLDLNAIDAEFRHGLVTITLPRQVEEKPKALKVNVRHAEPTLEAPANEPVQA
jgi:HSP20 family protein